MNDRSKAVLSVLVLSIAFSIVGVFALTAIDGNSGGVHAGLLDDCWNTVYPGSSGGGTFIFYDISTCSYTGVFTSAYASANIRNDDSVTRYFVFDYMEGGGTTLWEGNINPGALEATGWIALPGGEPPDPSQFGVYSTGSNINVLQSSMKLVGYYTTTTTATTAPTTTTTTSGGTTTATTTTSTATTTTTAPPPGTLNINVNAKVGTSVISGLTVYLFQDSDIFALDSGATNDNGDITFNVEENHYYTVSATYDSEEKVSEKTYCTEDWSPILTWTAPVDGGGSNGGSTSNGVVTVTTSDDPFDDMTTEEWEGEWGAVTSLVILPLFILSFLWIGAIIGSISRTGHPILWVNAILAGTIGTALYFVLRYFFSWI